jgi:hypothetical protein
MSFISLWAGRIEPPGSLPDHLDILYTALDESHFQAEPKVCAEREMVPIEELIEPFRLSEEFLAQASEAARRQSLKLGNTVVAVYTHQPPKYDSLHPDGCGLSFIGTFPLETPD